jgi:hypothetical protein
MGVVSCDGSEPLVSSGWLANARFGATLGTTFASLRFAAEDGTKADAELAHRMTTAFLEWRPLRRLSLSVGLGALVGGRVSIDWPTGTDRGELLPGFLGTASISYLAANEGKVSPFVLVGGQFGVGGERLRLDGSEVTERFTAFDARVSATVGKTFAKRLRPYLSVRAFGGPVLLGERAVGSDRYHLQVATGLAVVLPRGFDVFGEVAPGPERSIAFGVGFAPGR